MLRILHSPPPSPPSQPLPLPPLSRSLSLSLALSLSLSLSLSLLYSSPSAHLPLSKVHTLDLLLVVLVPLPSSLFSTKRASCGKSRRIGVSSRISFLLHRAQHIAALETVGEGRAGGLPLTRQLQLNHHPLEMFMVVAPSSASF